jgi:SAM-dependent methyltransferase
MNDNVFQRYSSYYDLLYRDKDYQAEAAYIGAILRAAAPGAKTVLEFGSGTGRHGRLLAAQGFHVFGIERSAEMVSAAQLRGAATLAEGDVGFDCVQGDIRHLELNRTFDVVLGLFHVVSYQTTNQDVLNTFTSASRHLRPGGIFLFDVWHGPAVLAERPSVRVKRVEDEEKRLTRIAEPELDTNASAVTVHYTMLVETKGNHQLTTFGEDHRLRYYFPQEIGLLASQTGFTVERSEEFVTRQPPGESTWGVVYQLRK